MPAGEERVVRGTRAVASAWPSAGREPDRPTATLPRQRSADRTQTWILVASAFVLGLVLGASALIGFWRTSTRQSDRADAARAVALREANGRSATLTSQLRRMKADLAAAVTQRKQTRAELRNALRRATLSAQAASNDRARLSGMLHDASTVKSYVAALDAYLRATPSQSLDSAFLRSQLSYLSAAAERLQKR